MGLEIGEQVDIAGSRAPGFDVTLVVDSASCHAVSIHHILCCYNVHAVERETRLNTNHLV